MASTTIPNLPLAISLTGTEQLEAVQSGSSVRVTASQIAGLAGNVDGPASATLNSVPTFSSTNGQTLQATSVTISVAGNLSVPGKTIQIATTNTPASSSAAGVAGTICWDTSYLYVCTATNTWKRIALTSF
jgi:hypothetical protein